MREVASSDLTLSALSGTTKDMRLYNIFWQGLLQQQVGFDDSPHDGFVFGLRQSETLDNFLYTARQVFELN
jgi:hypothetical protein